MPVYHFTFHAYGSWLPDHPKGFIKRNKGWQPTNPALAEHYRQGLRDGPADFTAERQQHALHILRASESPQRFSLYGFAGEPTHLHAVVGWTDPRSADQISQQLKASITRGLNQSFGKRQWLAKNAGLTPVCDHDHLYRLVCVYLPKHHGVCWQPERPETDK